MNEYEPIEPHEAIPPDGSPRVAPMSQAAGSSGDTGAFAPSAAQSAPPTPGWRKQWRRMRKGLSQKRTAWMLAAALLCAVIGLSVGLATSSSATTGHHKPTSGFAGGSGALGGGSNARSGPATGGASGTVATVSKSGFTISTSAGQKVTIHEASSTSYEKGTTATSASAISAGKDVLVLGTTNGTTITATKVILQPAGGSVTTTSSATKVIPFQRGAPTTSKQTGQIPADFSQGSGTIVSGTVANKATEAALAAYPGGIVDRVVALNTGDYNVHFIGVNWPHHVFVNQSFTVIGAE
jgi:hypothetical protein